MQCTQCGLKLISFQRLQKIHKLRKVGLEGETLPATGVISNVIASVWCTAAD